MIENLTPYLYFSALVFFNFFCIVSSIAALAVVYSIFSTKKRVTTTLNLLDEKIETASQMTFSLAESAMSFLTPRPQTIIETVLNILKKR